MVIEDCESNEHCSLTVYHQELDAILTKNDDGYIVLNPEVVESIKKTAEEEEQPVEDMHKCFRWIRLTFILRGIFTPSPLPIT